ncbi:MAG TPA: hypothetical protein VKV06_03785 [Acidimicrobiales bacterium]|nr:hypothetical protein [Acidimicrobiales bacterium]
MSDDPSATQAAGDGRRLRVGLGEALALVAAVLLVVSPFLATYSGHLLGSTYSYTGWHSLFITELVATELLGALVGVVVVLASLGLLPRSLPWVQWATGVAVAVLVGAIVSPIGYHQFLFQAKVRGSIGIGAGPYLAIGGAVVLLAGCVLASVPALNVALIGRPPKPAGALPAGSGGYDQMPGYAQGGYPGPGGGYYGQPMPGQPMPGQPMAGQPMPGQAGPSQPPTPGYGSSNPWSAPTQPASQTPSPWAPQPADAGPGSTERADQPGEPTPAWQQPVQPGHSLEGQAQPGQPQQGQPFGGRPLAEQPFGAQPQPGQALGGQPEAADRGEQPTQQQQAWQQSGQPQTGQPQTGQPQTGQPAWGEPSPWGLGAGSSSESPAGGTTQPPTAQQPAAAQEPAAGSFSPFWGAVPTPRTVFHPDNRQSPVGVVQPGAWYAVVAEQPGGALLVQMPDGSHALLTDTNDLIRA